MASLGGVDITRYRVGYDPRLAYIRLERTPVGEQWYSSLNEGQAGFYGSVLGPPLDRVPASLRFELHTKLWKALAPLERRSVEVAFGLTEIIMYFQYEGVEYAVPGGVRGQEGARLTGNFGALAEPSGYEVFIADPDKGPGLPPGVQGTGLNAPLSLSKLSQIGMAEEPPAEIGRPVETDIGIGQYRRVATYPYEDDTSGRYR